MSDDLWKTEDPEYSLDEFYTRSKDRQGHSTKMQVKVPDDLAGALSSLVQSGKIPEYRTVQDIFRDAIVHRLHYLSQNMQRIQDIPIIKETIRRLCLEQHTLQYAEEIKHYEDILERVETTCQKAIEIGDYERLAKYIEEQEEQIEVYREPFRSRLQAIFDRYREAIIEGSVPDTSRVRKLGGKRK